MTKREAVDSALRRLLVEPFTRAALERALRAEAELGVVDVVRLELLAGAGSDAQVETVCPLRLA